MDNINPAQLPAQTTTKKRRIVQIIVAENYIQDKLVSINIDEVRGFPANMMLAEQIMHGANSVVLGYFAKAIAEKRLDSSTNETPPLIVTPGRMATDQIVIK